MSGPVWRLCPGVRKPTMSISGQSRCSGSGPPWMSCGRLSLLTNVTRPPTATVASNGMSPNGVIDTLAVVGGVAGAGAGAGDGAGAGLGDGTADGAGPPEEPQPPATTARAKAT